MQRGLQLVVLALMSTLLMSCAAVVEERLSMRPTAFTLEGDTEASLRILQLDSREFCLPFLGGCTGYLYGKPYHLLAQDGQDKYEKFDFDFAFDVGDRIEEYQLSLKREEVSPQRGTVVLLHGYGGDKSTMATNAGYFMFLGYHVIAPDLLGHGESTTDQMGFGVRDADMISALLDSLPQRETPGPLYLAGLSMGTVAAAQVAKQRDDVDGLILFAPMAPMDEATNAMLELWFPRMSKLMPTESIREGVIGAMQRQDIELAETDLQQLLPQLDVPTLMIASDMDTVAPYERYLPLESAKRKLVMAPGRHHITVGIIDNELHQHISAWLAAH
ncbi:alpha/beta hydrolase [Pseudidiomarina homiensis]|uniref:alpha/beta hydrolase n=1 Tax=Pseudidiomarina homiensis TaxID=364198 RepID=UPI00215A8FC8|nr:lysophospholipase [Pseudidiomarina homiensis]